jgi:hypothetical protein
VERALVLTAEDLSFGAAGFSHRTVVQYRDVCPDLTV